MRVKKLCPVLLVALGAFQNVPRAIASDITLHPEPASKGCPVDLSVLEQVPGRLVPVTPDGKGEHHLVVRLQSVDGKALHSAEITIYGYPASWGFRPANAEPQPARVKKVQVWWRDKNGALGADVMLDWVGVRLVRVNSIRYAESGSWTPSDEQYCVAAPKGTMLMGGLQ